MATQTEVNRCSICLTSFGDQYAPTQYTCDLSPIDQRIVTLVCEHEFHLECIDGWLKERNTCPLCKREIAEERDQSQESRRQIVHFLHAVHAASPISSSRIVHRSSIRASLRTPVAPPLFNRVVRSPQSASTRKFQRRHPRK